MASHPLFHRAATVGACFMAGLSVMDFMLRMPAIRMCCAEFGTRTLFLSAHCFNWAKSRVTGSP